MTTKQQLEALDYFGKHAADWRSKAQGLGTSAVNVIEQRNNYVLQIAAEKADLRSFLDVGCGTGELVCQAAARGIDSTGVDYAPQMIELAAKKARDERLSGAKFVCSSIFDFEMQKTGYDLISANGFIEYISQAELQAFFERVAQALTPGGSFVVGSRNRLFNLVSMNEFTLKEIESAEFKTLAREAVKWMSARAIPKVSDSDCAPFQAPDTEHVQTGIGVATRYQYTPFQLINLLAQKGLRAIEVYPVHIHGVMPGFHETNIQVHVSISDYLQTHARQNLQLLTQASTFMLHVTK